MDQMKIDSPWKLTTVQGSGPFPTQEIDVSGIKRKWLDVAYADQSPAQKLDIFLPDEGEGPFPVYIFMHGGAYLFGAKRDAQLFHAIDGVTKGYAVVTVEQRLAGEAQFPYGLFDLKAAIRYLRANAAQYKLDPEKFALAGDSAGAYYAIMCAATQDIPGFEDETMGNAGVSSKVQSVIGFYGGYDRMKMLPPEMPEPPKGAAPGPGAGGPPMPDLYQALVGAKPRRAPRTRSCRPARARCSTTRSWRNAAKAVRSWNSSRAGTTAASPPTGMSPSTRGTSISSWINFSSKTIRLL